MPGFVEIITLLLALAGFGLSPNPKAATADQALHYAIADADVVAHVDVASIVPGNYKALVALPRHPQLRSSPDLVKAARQLVNEVEGARGMARSTTGIDPVTDVSDVTLFVKVLPHGDPDVIVAARGRFSRSVLANISKMTHQPVSQVGAGSMIQLPGDKPSIGLTKDGVLLLGTPRLVRDRLAPSWRPPTTASLGYARQALDARPVLSVVATLSPATRRQLAAAMGPKKNFVTDLAGRHRAFAFSMYHDGIGWTWVDRNRRGLDQVALMSDGFIELLRAAHIAPRGIAKMMLGAIESYRGVDRRIDAIISRKADLMKLVETYTGDGKFNARVQKDPRTNRLDVRLSAGSLSHVVPLGLLAPAGALTFFMLRSGGAKVPPSTPVRVSPPPPARPQPRPYKRP